MILSETVKPKTTSSQSHINDWLRKAGVKKYVINDDGTVDVDGNVDISYMELASIPVQFGTITGSFLCSNNKLVTLRGCPTRVMGVFNCHANKLSSLEYSPRIVGSDFVCGNNLIHTLHDIHKIINKIGRILYLIDLPITSAILGVFFIKGLKSLVVTHSPGSYLTTPDEILTSILQKRQTKTVDELKLAVAIVNKHLNGDRDVHQCQEELIKAGLSEYAKL